MLVGVVGTGFVGAASAYAMAIRGSVTELVLVDANEAKAQAEASDIADATPFTHPVRVRAGSYADLAGARVVVMSAGVNQKPGETRLQLLERNAAIFRTVIPQIVHHARDAVIVVSANPVDIMTELTERLAYAAGAPAATVLGTGTVLDTARFRQLVGAHVQVDARHVHGYVFGEHGDSEVLGWSSLDIAGLPVEQYAETAGIAWGAGTKASITNATVRAADAIISGKGATYFGIGACTARLVESIVRDQRSIYTVTASVPEYGCSIAVPRLVSGRGVGEVLSPGLGDDEAHALQRSAEVLRSYAARLPTD
ncbi:MAG TPA: L-lactate dehydrogenase [Dermatophilaceae bacterium]|nr:L-lactate dehydrogenase [Dermatophilaceae bacterium]